MSETFGIELVLWRHAEAEDAVPGKIIDADRALTPRGFAQASRMATWLNARLPTECRVLVSPAVRTCQTALALSRPFERDARVGLDASPQSVLDAADWPHARGVTVVVGHQPTLGETAASLLPGLDMSWNLHKGAIVWIAHRAGAGRREAVLRVALTPEAIKAV